MFDEHMFFSSSQKVAISYKVKKQKTFAAATNPRNDLDESVLSPVNQLLQITVSSNIVFHTRPPIYSELQCIAPKF